MPQFNTVIISDSEIEEIFKSGIKLPFAILEQGPGINGRIFESPFRERKLLKFSDQIRVLY